VPKIIQNIHISGGTLDYYNPSDNDMLIYGKEIDLTLDDITLLDMKKHMPEA